MWKKSQQVMSSLLRRACSTDFMTHRQQDPKDWEELPSAALSPPASHPFSIFQRGPSRSLDLKEDGSTQPLALHKMKSGRGA